MQAAPQYGPLLPRVSRARFFVHDEHVSVRQIDDTARRRTEDPIESAITMASNDDEIGLDFIGDVENHAPRRPLSHERLTDRRKRCLGAQPLQLD